jgi:RimJ/RimL family protein N-acetyltransferase
MVTYPDVLLRSLDQSDLDRVRAWLEQPSVRDWLLVSKAPSYEEQQQWYLNYRKDHTRMVYAIDYRHQHIGNVALSGINRQQHEANLNIFIGESHLRGKGLGFRILKILFGLASHDFKLTKLSAEVRHDNFPAIRLYEKSGMICEGLLPSKRQFGGRRLDMVIYSIILPGKFEGSFNAAGNLF